MLHINSVKEALQFFKVSTIMVDFIVSVKIKMWKFSLSGWSHWSATFTQMAANNAGGLSSKGYISFMFNVVQVSKVISSFSKYKSLWPKPDQD